MRRRDAPQGATADPPPPPGLLHFARIPALPRHRLHRQPRLQAFIIVDPPPEEGEEFFSLCDEFGLSFVPLAGTAHARDPRQSRPPRASCCSRRTPVASAFSSMRIPDNYTLLLFVIRNSNTTPRVESVSRSEEIL